MSKLVPLKFRAKVVADYFVDSNNGDIYSGKRTTLLKMTPSFDGNGYMKIDICSPGIPKNQRVHRLVAETLIPFPCPQGITKAEWKATPQSVKNLLCSQYRVNHIDHDRSNYHPQNLEWVTARGNSLAYVAYSARDKHYGTSAKKQHRVAQQISCYVSESDSSLEEFFGEV